MMMKGPRLGLPWLIASFASHNICFANVVQFYAQETMAISIISRMWEKLSLVLVPSLPLLLVLLQDQLIANAAFINFSGEAFTPWDPSHLLILDNGWQLQLVLDEKSGSGLASADKYMFGNLEIQMKVAPGDTAGTVTSFYLSSATENRDELDFEFLGNVSGEPYLLQTNIFTNGTGYREQRISLWFDPTADFHKYSISWTKQRVIFSVDGTAIRTFPNNEEWGQLYVDRNPMGAFLSIWNGDDWATLGGLVKINWTAAPFIASYRDFEANACTFNGNASMCIQSQFATMTTHTNLYANQLDLSSLKWIEDNYMVYNYCNDKDRYQDVPLECTLPT